VYSDVEAARSLGYPDVIAPPTFPIVMTLRAAEAVVADPALGLDYSTVVHGEQSFSYSRPIQAGDVLQVTVSIESVRSIGGNDMLVTRGDVTTLDGEHVVTASSMLAPGFELPEQSFQIERADMVKYAGASGDFNPIHWSESSATAVGLNGVIAHGMLTMGLVARVATDWTGDPGSVLEYSVRFTRPVVVPDGPGARLDVSGKIRSVDAEAQQAVLELTAKVNGETVLAKARVTVRLPSV
jgi:acyl dehydratase